MKKIHKKFTLNKQFMEQCLEFDMTKEKQISTMTAEFIKTVNEVLSENLDNDVELFHVIIDISPDGVK